MLTIPLPLPSASLQFTPPLESLGTLAQLLLFGVGLAMFIGLMLWLYRFESQLVAPSTARWLLGLRTLGLALLWAVMFLRPSIVRTSEESVPAKVLIALDRSGSMDIPDPQRSDAEKLRIIKRFQLARDLVSDEVLDSWLKLAESPSGLQFRSVNGSEDWDEKKRYTQVIERLDTLSRAKLAERLLAPTDRPGLLDALAAKHAVEVVGFAQEMGELPSEANALRTALSTPNPGALFGTDERLPLSRALEQSSPDRTKILGVVLISDGQHNWGTPPVSKALELGQAGLPVYPIVVGPRQGPPDVAVVRVQGPSAVFQKTDASIEARVQVSNLPPGRVRVKLQLPDGPDGKKRDPIEETIEHDGKNHAYTLRFSAKLEDAGVQELKVTAEYEPEGTNPAREEFITNNTGSTRISVAPDRAKVLVIDGEARWEYHYLTTALLRDPTMDVRGVVFRQPRLGRVSDTELTKSGFPELKLPTDPDAYLAYDCIILGDVSPEDLPLAERQRLEKYVAERGGTLVIVAGKRWMPMQFLGAGAAGADADPLMKLLPVQNLRAINPQIGFPVSLTGEGKLAPFLRMEATSEQSLDRWSKLPDHYWGVVGKAKEGAVPLAFVRPRNAKAPANPDAARQEERDQSLFVRQNYGFGRVLFVGLESTWRWRYKAGDLYHHRFWGQVIRWAATDKPLITGDERIRFGTREPVYRQDQSIELLARLSDQLPKPANEALQGARLIRLPSNPAEKEQVVGLVPLKSSEFRPRELTGATRDLPPGDYAMELVLPDYAETLAAQAGPQGDPLKMRAKFSVLPPDGAEMVELAPNWPLMEEVAAKSGGQVYSLDNADALVEQLARQVVTRENRQVNRLWQSWWTLLLFLGFITGEWALRKWAGLP